jgi:hypothetical protein
MKNRKYIPIAMAGLIAFGGFQAQVNAGMVETNQFAAEISMQEQRSALVDLMTREDVARQLNTMGVDIENAKERVASLSDAEIQQLHNKLDQLPAGSGAAGTVLVVLLILILLDVAGVTDIFPGV